MQNKTKDNVQAAFIGEAKAYFRLLAYAEKAEEERVPQIALLFRAIAEAERVHATRNLNLIKDLVIKDTVNTYYVCQVCGYVADAKIPEKCPVCGAPKEQFKTVEK